MKKHSIELDSLRGLAALSVLIGHFLIVYPLFESNTYGLKGMEVLNLFKYTPLHFFWSGHQAVILFFVLSGFVLSLAFYKENFNFTKEWYSIYIVKRLSRIYIPYIISTVIFIVLFIIINPKINIGFSDFVNRNLNKEFNVFDIIGHLFLIGDYNAKAVNPVIWSLIHEMRISIIFPFLMLVILKLDTKFIISFAIIVGVFSQGIMFLYGMTEETGIVYTLYFTPLFMMGALVAKNISKLTSFFKQLNLRTQIFVAILSTTLYTFPWIFYGLSEIHITVIDDWATALGACLFIVLAISSKRLSKLLSFKPIVFTGKISFSLYLYHVPIVLILLYLYHDYLAIWNILFISLVISYIFAALSYYFIEVPAMKFGRRISNQKNELFSIDSKELV
ncbi:acyltransferase family protein [Exiguobacterium aestuarii]|uniref:acyltransferase family protein n=1 Tax=Exiguobacterium aestuarii TaxID=273527 RepID=UPI001CD42FE7|nr:acyltransferase [Exiguobacterium aestuarii]MCA0981203.1 acyltransferase [Exiguobacterium aestuarii]